MVLAGFGPPGRQRVRYTVLRECLLDVGRFAKELQASVHMPRIGSGGGGGDWYVVRELARETLADQGVVVTVYPNRDPL